MKYQKFLKMKNLLESSNQQAQEILSIQESLSARMDDDLKGLGETSRQCTETLRRLEEQTTEIQGIRSTILSARQMKPKDLDKILQSAYKTILKVYSQGKDRARIHRQILLQLQRVNFHQFQVRDSEHLAVDQLELIGSTLERVEEETLNFSIQPPQPYTNSVLQQQVTLINQKSVAVWNGIEKRKRLRSCLQALYTVVENKASQVEEKNKQLEEIVAECYLIVTGNSSHQTSRPPSPPPSSPGGEVGSLEGSSLGSASASFTAYDVESNFCALQGLQCSLGNTLNQASNLLRMLSLKTMAISLKQNYAERELNTIVTSPKLSFCKTAIEQPVSSSQPSLDVFIPFQGFSSTDKYSSNGEDKLCSAQIGFVMCPTEKFTMGVGYDYVHEIPRKYKEDSTLVTKTRSTIHIFSSIFSWNTNGVGFTGHITGCCGWGDINNTRYFIHGRGKASSKGMPRINLSGGLLQIGYNFPISNVMTITPYIEGMLTTVAWNAYHESIGPVRCKVSDYRETSCEKSVGLRHSYTPSSKTQLQLWIAGVLGQYNIGKLHSDALFSDYSYHTTVPLKRKNYEHAELGINYEMYVSDLCTIGLYSIIIFSHIQKPTDKTMRVSLQYMY
ncbi:hypothetical protein BW722_06740 [Lawsonia intracellularis]|nr:hypothetical protein BW722_06740 [Lawsonia intracellularis]